MGRYLRTAISPHRAALLAFMTAFMIDPATALWAALL